MSLEPKWQDKFEIRKRNDLVPAFISSLRDAITLDISFTEKK